MGGEEGEEEAEAELTAADDVTLTLRNRLRLFGIFVGCCGCCFFFCIAADVVVACSSSS